MNTFIIKSLVLLFIVSIFYGCMSVKQIKEAKEKSDSLLTEIAEGNAEKEFPTKYFNSSQTKYFLNQLKYNCDFANRKGHYINDFTMNENGVNRVAFIYEYYLKCDSLRFILTYNLGNKIELYRFKMEPIEKDNFMIRKPERRLKY